jgi:hypothetical protein
MDRGTRAADAADAMTTVIRHHKRAGRFGREIREDAPMRDAATTIETGGADAPSDAVSYVIDPDAVADAIISRLVAGRTIPPPGPARERRG